MNIAILGGTGKEGSGLAMRWAVAGHAIIIGSRDAARAHDKAIELRARTKKLTFGGPRLFTPPAAGSSAEEVQALLPEAKVVAAFHHIAAHELAEAEHDIEC